MLRDNQEVESLKSLNKTSKMLGEREVRHQKRRLEYLLPNKKKKLNKNLKLNLPRRSKNRKPTK